MKRRTVVKGLAAAAAYAAVRPAFGLETITASRKDWDELRAKLGNRLMPVQSPLAEIAKAGGQGADEFFARIQNPYLLGDDPALTQTLGWVDAWTSQPSDYAVAAESASDVAEAVNFAREKNVRLVVKGGGHSYFGNSNAAGSLLIWTRRMRDIRMHEGFVPAGSPAGTAGVPAVSIGAGALWGQVYDAVAVKGGRYVQGGGCLTVGVAGFVQGGGFGSFSKRFGTGASNLLEAEVVTADGRTRTVNQMQDPELFHALKGGGGGGFGVVTNLTLRTDELPATIGAVLFEVTANSDAAWRVLVDRTLGFYAASLHNPQWGEQLRFSPGRKLSVSMLFNGLSEEEARATWKPFLEWISGSSRDYSLASEPLFLAVPARKFWDARFLGSLPGIIMTDDRPNAAPSNIYWASNRGEAGQLLHAYQSAWLPQSLLGEKDRPRLVEALTKASAEWPVTLHTNKGMGGGDAAAIARTRDTATNPELLDAFALLICAAEGRPAWPGIAGHEPDLVEGRRAAAGVARAMQPIRQLVPNAGTYASEADYFQKEWKRAYWGANYPRLAAAKRAYDPNGLFRTHHGVESS